MRPEQVEGDGWVVPPMFEVTAAEAVTRGELRKSAAARAVTWAICPGCTNGSVGLLRSGRHLVWRYHEKVTMSGARMPCHTSGAPICEVPPSAGSPSCPHA